MPSTEKNASAQPRRWGFGAILLGLIAFVGSQLVVATLFFTLFGADAADSTAMLFYVYAAATLLTLVILVRILRHFNASFRDLGLGAFKLNYLWLAMGGFVVYMVVTSVLLGLAAEYFPQLNLDQEQDLGFKDVNGLLAQAIVFVSLVIIPPVVEELLFRGLIFKGLGRHFRPVMAAVLTSILFGAAHMQWNVGLDTFALSLVLCALVHKTGSLWPAILLHAIKNLAAFLVVFIVKS